MPHRHNMVDTIQTVVLLNYNFPALKTRSENITDKTSKITHLKAGTKQRAELNDRMKTRHFEPGTDANKTSPKPFDYIRARSSWPKIL